MTLGENTPWIVNECEFFVYMYILWQNFLQLSIHLLPSHGTSLVIINREYELMI